MKTASTILLIAAGAAVLAAVWAPGAWWQWAITAIVLFLAGAGTGGAAAQKRQRNDEAHREIYRRFDDSKTHINGEWDKIREAAKPAIDHTVEQARREYGRKADDQ